MADDDLYVVVLDKELDYCRLFRADCEVLPEGEILWSGNGLRRGYDAMIRLNKDRKPVNAYNVCSSTSKAGRTVFRLVKDEPRDKGMKVEATFYDYSSAREHLGKLKRERDAAERANKEKMLRLLRRVGINSNRVPKFTETDRRYIEWLRDNGKLDGIEPLAA